MEYMHHNISESHVCPLLELSKYLLYGSWNVSIQCQRKARTRYTILEYIYDNWVTTQLKKFMWLWFLKFKVYIYRGKRRHYDYGKAPTQKRGVSKNKYVKGWWTYNYGSTRGSRSGIMGATSALSHCNLE